MSYFLYRRSVTIKVTLRVIQAYDFNLETLPTKNLHKIRSEINIENSRSPLNNYANTLMMRKSV